MYYTDRNRDGLDHLRCRIYIHIIYIITSTYIYIYIRSMLFRQNTSNYDVIAQKTCKYSINMDPVIHSYQVVTIPSCMYCLVDLVHVTTVYFYRYFYVLYLELKITIACSSLCMVTTSRNNVTAQLAITITDRDDQNASGGSRRSRYRSCKESATSCRSNKALAGGEVGSQSHPIWTWYTLSVTPFMDF